MNHKCTLYGNDLNLTSLEYKQRFVNHKCVIGRELEFDRWYLWLNTNPSNKEKNIIGEENQQHKTKLRSLCCVT